MTVEWTVELTIHVKGDDQENMLFLYPVRGFQLTGGGSSNSLGFPSLYGANGEENRTEAPGISSWHAVLIKF